jgi:iron complex transport system ATP-binding protein
MTALHEPAPVTALPPPPLLAARGVEVTIEGNEIVRGIDLQVRAGEVTGLVGPNGAGKSTLLRAVTGTVPMTSGTVELGGQPLDSRSKRDRAREIAVVQQLPEAPPTMRVADLVLLGRFPHLGLLGRETQSDYRIAQSAMERAGCAEFAERALGTLSGGERRRAFIARALAQEPRLLLLDEPTANLDAEAQAEIFELLRQLAADGVGVLIVVHDLTLAAAYCDRLVMLHRGQVAAAGAPREVITLDCLRPVYGSHVAVLHHPTSGAPVVIPAILEGTP